MNNFGPWTPEELLVGAERVEQLAALPTDDHRLLWLAASALLGPQWQSELARVLSRNVRNVRRVAAGEFPVREEWLRRIAVMLVATREKRAARLEAAEVATGLLLDRFGAEALRGDHPSSPGSR